jgi:hypothetical protein
LWPCHVTPLMKKAGKGALDCTLAGWLIDGDGYGGGMA